MQGLKSDVMPKFWYPTRMIQFPCIDTHECALMNLNIFYSYDPRTHSLDLTCLSQNKSTAF